MPINVRELPDDELDAMLDKWRSDKPPSGHKTTKRRKSTSKKPTITQAALTALLAELKEENSNANTD